MKAAIVFDAVKSVYVLQCEGSSVDGAEAQSVSTLTDLAFGCGCLSVRHEYDLVRREERIFKGEETP